MDSNSLEVCVKAWEEVFKEQIKKGEISMEEVKKLEEVFDGLKEFCLTTIRSAVKEAVEKEVETITAIMADASCSPGTDEGGKWALIVEESKTD